MLTAPVTLAPMILFTLALKRTSLTSVGLLQYLEPSLQFALTTLISGEVLEQHKLISLCFIWLGLLLCVLEPLKIKGLHNAVRLK